MSDATIDHPDLVRLLRGELTNDAVLAAEDHLVSCAQCLDELPATVTGHALLTRSVAVLGTDRAAGEVEADLPPLAPLARTRRLPGARLVLVAALVLVAVGIGVRLLGGPGSDDSPGSPPTVLAALDAVEGTGTGEVRMTAAGDHSTRMTIRVDGLPPAARGDYYYAWLFDPTTQKMLPLGLIGLDGSATFRIDESLVAAYSAVDVSLEADDGDPAHSVTSVLRGTYAT